MADSTDTSGDSSTTSTDSSLLNSIFNTGLGIAKAQLSPTNQPAAPKAPAASATSNTKWLYIGGAALVGVVLLVLMLKRR